MEERDIIKYMDLFTDYIRNQLNKLEEDATSRVASQKESDIEKNREKDIYERLITYIKLLISIAKIFYSIG